MAILSIANLKIELNTYIDTNGIDAITGTILNNFLDDLIDSVLAVGVIATSIGSPAPNNVDGNEGDLYFQTNVGCYRKTSGVWVLAISISKKVITKNQSNLVDAGGGNWYLPMLDGSNNPFPSGTVALKVTSNGAGVQFIPDDTNSPPRLYGFANNATQTILLTVF